MLKTCTQCGKYFTAKRSDARFCSDTCRKRASRGIEPQWWYLANPDTETRQALRYEQVLASIAENDPKAFKSLSDLKAMHGQKALEKALDAIMLLVIN